MNPASGYTLLIVDDDKSSHIIIKKILDKKYTLLHAKEAQQAINILSEKKVDLILSDIHMPGMSGLEFLEALRNDPEKKAIPILLITSMPTVEKEQKAMNLGAKDFIKKELLHRNPEEILQRIEMKLVSNLNIPDLTNKLVKSQKLVTQEMMVYMESKDFLDVSMKFCNLVAKLFELDHLSFWKLSKKEPNLLVTVGLEVPMDYKPEDLYTELVFRRMIKDRKPYYTNNIFNTRKGVFVDGSRKEGLPSEIGVPMFAVTESELIRNEMKIPDKAPVFGYILMKRSKVFSTKEYTILSKLIIRCSTMLWRLYKTM